MLALYVILLLLMLYFELEDSIVSSIFCFILSLILAVLTFRVFDIELFFETVIATILIFNGVVNVYAKSIT
jgi:hypothetical protein